MKKKLLYALLVISLLALPLAGCTKPVTLSVWEPKEGWLVHVEFEDDKYEYSVQMDVQMADGRITRSVELRREPLQK